MGDQLISAEPVLSTGEAQALTDEIRGAVSRTLDAMADVEQVVTRAYEGRAWASLGHPSWEAYCTAEFSETRLWATVEERQARTLSLREAGMSQRAIAAVLGVNQATVSREVAQLSGDADASPDNAPVAPVSLVGVDGNAQPTSKPVTHELLERRLTTARLNEEGLSQEQIASQVGVSQATVSNDLREVGTLETRSPQEFAALVSNPNASSQDVLDSFDHLAVPSVNLGELTQHALRDLELNSKFLFEQIVMADEWIERPQRRAAVAAIVPKAGDALLVLLKALGEIKADDLPQDAKVLLRWSQTINHLRAELDKVVTA